MRKVPLYLPAEAKAAEVNVRSVMLLFNTNKSLGATVKFVVAATVNVVMVIFPHAKLLHDPGDARATPEQLHSFNAKSLRRP